MSSHRYGKGIMATMGRKRPTMLDVAEKVGVSRASVSLAFRGAPGIGEETRQRILAAADELGYSRDEAARGLRAAHPTNIGACFDTRQQFQLEVVDGLYEAVHDTDYQLVLSGRSHRRDERDAIDTLMAFRSGVLILISSSCSERELVALAERVPIVSIGRQVRSSELTWVVSDDLGGMNAAISHLKDLGHSDITYLSAVSEVAGRDRLRAFHRAMTSNHLTGQARVMDGGSTELAGVLAAEAMLESKKLPTAVIGFNDRCALGVLQVFRQRGIRVPEDVSIVGIDDSEIAANRPVNMTSIHQDPTLLARLAIERAQAIMDPAPGRPVPRGTLVPTSLTIRETTGPARG